jgi:alpha-amylase/alpha-mannosidase (GH57 family)
MKRYLCIHGHFYQPPRENPWLEEIEVQDSASPYHDWNERVSAECYKPNTAARIVDHENRILDIVNNYAKISFNFGPTLLSWMERAEPEVYRQILKADEISLRERGGHGNALAQVYNHIIMPLASRRDKVTQVRWGIADFEPRFKRKPEGMWLAETAVDRETLQVLAEEGILFTILAPAQASRIRKIMVNEEKEGGWEDVSGSKIDPTRPYRCMLEGGLKIDLFFYDGPISHAIAFDKLLQSGEAFVERLKGGFSDERNWPQLLHIATDGESYGHHFPHGDMALAYTLLQIERQEIAELTNYGEFLSKNPAAYEVEIFEKSSWSCAHGVERWRSNCGCQPGGHPEWTQAWRQPLREGLNQLKNSLDLIFESSGKKWISDPWKARDSYIELIRKKEEGGLKWEVMEAFLSQHRIRPLNGFEKEQTMKLFEIQRNALLMFTSCAWFFDEISGLETTQVLKYAGRAIQLAKEIDTTGLARKSEGDFIEKLKTASSNIAEFENGAQIYQRFIKTSLFNTRRLIAVFALTSLFEAISKGAEFCSYRIDIQDYQKVEDGMITLAIGKVRVTSKITFTTEEAIFGVIHFGGHDFYSGVGGILEAEEYDQMKSELVKKFHHGSQADVVKTMIHYFGGEGFSLKDLFMEERRKILFHITRTLFSRYENMWREVYLDHQKLMLYLQSTQTKIPKTFLITAEQVLNHDLGNLISLLPQAINQLLKLTEEAKKWGITLELQTVEKRLRALIEDQMRTLIESELSQSIHTIHRFLDIAEQADIHIILWEAQNLFHLFLQKKKALGVTRAFQVNDQIVRLAERLSYCLGPEHKVGSS